MEILVLGILLWSVVHFVPALAQPLKKNCIDRIGENGYKGLFSILVIVALGLIIYGWRHATPSFLYALPPGVKPAALLLLLLAFVLFGASKHPTRIKRVVRHPQLCGVITWAIAHLLLNGDSRSLVLFGGMGLWAILEIVFINRREGVWVRPEAPSWGIELRGLAISLLILVVAAFAHPWIAGVAIR